MRSLVVVSSAAAGILAALLAVRCEASGFFDADQDAVRADVEYLVNAGALHIPVSTWPMPIDEVHAAVAAVDDAALSSGESAALTRLKLVLDRYDTPDDDTVSAAASVHPTHFRQNEPLPREDASIGFAMGRDYGRFTVHIAAGINSREPKDTLPVDRQRFRIDGSYASMQTGNWIWSVGEMARSWGPSQHDSLVLSTNARPIPSVGLDRLSSRAPKARWLRWVGPWRLSGFLGSLEHDRNDVRDPLFVGARFTFKPVHNLELGLTRTSQVCGRGRQCNLTTFKNWLFGNTNTGTSAGITSATDPGNDMAGFDLRWTSPIGHLPYAVYAQMIGEDQQGGVPFKYLGEFGVDLWKSFDSGNVLHVNLEYTNTACSFTRKDPIYGCSYRHYIFNKDGYRYKDRIIGSTWEADSEVTTLNLRWVKRSGDEWQLHARHGQLNRGGITNNYDIDAPTKRNLDGVDVEYRFSSKNWGDFRTGVGIDRLKDPLGRQIHRYGPLVCDVAPPDLSVSTPLLIRDAEQADLPQILQIYNEVIANTTAVYSETPASLADRESWWRSRLASSYPVLVGIDASGVVGFSSFGDFRSFPCYAPTVEHSVHVRADRRGAGLGPLLVRPLFSRAAALGKHTMIAGVDAHNDASLRMHARLGFERVALFTEVGRKFGRWLDLVFMQRRIDGREP